MTGSVNPLAGYLAGVERWPDRFQDGALSTLMGAAEPELAGLVALVLVLAVR